MLGSEGQTQQRISFLGRAHLVKFLCRGKIFGLLEITPTDYQILYLVFFASMFVYFHDIVIRIFISPLRECYGKHEVSQFEISFISEFNTKILSRFYLSKTSNKKKQQLSKVLHFCPSSASFFFISNHRRKKVKTSSQRSPSCV